MARHALLPRLATLDADAVAIDVVTAALSRLRVEAAFLAPFQVFTEAAVDPLATDVAKTVRALVAYARGEERLRDPGKAIDDVARAAGVDPKVVSIAIPVGLLLAAAEGRRAFEAGETMSVRDMATLGGFDPKSLRRLAVQGKVEGKYGTEPPFVFEPDVARAWLEAHGIRRVGREIDQRAIDDAHRQ